MSVKQNLFAFTLAALFCVPVFAGASPDTKPTENVTKEIKTLIEKINLDYSKLDNQTIRVKFMVNETGELIVISTNEPRLDRTLKSALNYKKVDAQNLKPYNPYIVPIKFEISKT